MSTPSAHRTNCEEMPLDSKWADSFRALVLFGPIQTQSCHFQDLERLGLFAFTSPWPRLRFLFAVFNFGRVHSLVLFFIFVFHREFALLDCFLTFQFSINSARCNSLSTTRHFRPKSLPIPAHQKRHQHQAQPQNNNMLITRGFSLTNFVIGSSALCFQIFVLYPWHHKLDAEFTELRKEHARLLEDTHNKHRNELRGIREQLVLLNERKDKSGKWW